MLEGFLTHEQRRTITVIVVDSQYTSGARGSREHGRTEGAHRELVSSSRRERMAVVNT